MEPLAKKARFGSTQKSLSSFLAPSVRCSSSTPVQDSDADITYEGGPSDKDDGRSESPEQIERPSSSLIHPSRNRPDPSCVPKQVLSNKKLSYQDHWSDQFNWLHWKDGKLLCFYCSEIDPRTLPDVNNCDPAFIDRGFSNFKKAKQTFDSHETTPGHTSSVSIFNGRKLPTVSAVISKTHQKEQQKSRVCLEVIVSTLKLLGRQGVAIRGSDHDDGNFIQTLKSRSNEVPEMKQWLLRIHSSTSRQRHMLSSDIQNEILRDYSHAILRQLQKNIQASDSFALICDGTQDSSGKEQESVCIRYVDHDLHPREVFVGFYELEDTSGASIALMLQDVCTRLDLPLTKLRGQTYDGASNMKGSYSGAQARIAQIQPLAHYFHCAAHMVNLVAKDAMAASELVRDSVGIVNDMGVLFSTTIKYRNVYSDLGGSEVDGPKKLRPLCPTRWALKYEGVNTVATYYKDMLTSLEKFQEQNISAEQKAKSNGILTKLEQGSTYLGINYAEQVLSPLHLLSKSLQATSSTLEGTIEAVETCRSTLQGLRDGFEKDFDTKAAEIEEMKLEPLTVPRRRRPPARYTGNGEAYHAETPQSHFKNKFCEVIDTARLQLKERFKPDNTNDLSSHLALLGSFKGNIPKDVVSNYPELNYSELAAEIVLFQKKFKTSTLAAAASALRTCHPEVRAMFPAVEKLVRLLLVRPSTSCEAERSFSALRRLKSYLRSTMTAGRLNSVAIMNYHQDVLDEVPDEEILENFVSRTDWRKTTFG